MNSPESPSQPEMKCSFCYQQLRLGKSGFEAERGGIFCPATSTSHSVVPASPAPEEPNQRCEFCLGYPDHKHANGRNCCGDCCSMHGGLCSENKRAYDWVRDIVNAHNEHHASLERKLAALTAFSEVEIEKCRRCGKIEKNHKNGFCFGNDRIPGTERFEAERKSKVHKPACNNECDGFEDVPHNPECQMYVDRENLAAFTESGKTVDAAALAALSAEKGTK